MSPIAALRRRPARAARSWAARAAVLAPLAGCAPEPFQPPAGYLLPADGAGTALPVACLVERVDATLPFGCANNLNLARMVEEPRDLVRARPLGPAPAGPLARAVEGYLNFGGRLGAIEGGGATTGVAGTR